MDANRAPHIEVKPGVLFGAPTVGHSRMSAVQVAEMWWAGNIDSERLKRDRWPVASMAEVKLACWWMQEQGAGARKWRLRYKAWAEANFEAMWHGDWDAVPNPPQDGEVPDA